MAKMKIIRPVDGKLSVDGSVCESFIELLLCCVHLFRLVAFISVIARLTLLNAFQFLSPSPLHYVFVFVYITINNTCGVVLYTTTAANRSQYLNPNTSFDIYTHSNTINAALQLIKISLLNFWSGQRCRAVHVQNINILCICCCSLLYFAFFPARAFFPFHSICLFCRPTVWFWVIIASV